MLAKFSFLRASCDAFRRLMAMSNTELASALEFCHDGPVQGTRIDNDPMPIGGPVPGGRVCVVGNIPGLDILPGDIYRVLDVDHAGRIRIEHGLGLKFDVFLDPIHFKAIPE